MKAKLFKTMLCAGMASTLLTGCMDDNVYNPDATKKQFEQNWKKQFGEIDPNQTWNMATKANLSISTKDAGLIEVFTKNPALDGSMLLLRKQVNAGTHDLRFDVPQGTDKVFVQVCNAVGPYVNGYLPLDGTTAVAKAANAPATRADACPVTVGDKASTSVWFDNANHIFNYTKLKGFEKVEKDEFVTMDDLILYFGQENSVLKEGKDNIAKYVLGDKHVMEKDVVFTVKEPSEVSLDLFYCGTIYEQSFGVIFFKEGQDPYTQGRNYLLGTISDNDIRKVVPAYTDAWDKKNEEQNNFEANDNNNNSSVQLGRALDYKQNPNNNGWCKQYTLMNSYKKTFKIPYVDEQGNTTYIFPAGTKVAFFLLCDKKPRTSISAINERYGLQYTLHEAVAAATYRYGKTTFLTFEDSTDGNYAGDLNDFVFFLNGNFAEKPVQMDSTAEPDPDPVEPTQKETQSWILACEDLGNTDDFDFNDIVFKVSHVAGSDKAYITPLAAGGTLSAHIWYNNQDWGEIHKLLGGDENKPAIMNTTSRGQAGEAIEITVADGFSMINNMGGFSVRVSGKWNNKDIDAVSTEIKAPVQGEAPQMICIDGSTNWAWPTERTKISDAYLGFGEWGANYGATDWYLNPNPEHPEYIVR